jgi:hypothetical protein
MFIPCLANISLSRNQNHSTWISHTDQDVIKPICHPCKINVSINFSSYINSQCSVYDVLWCDTMVKGNLLPLFSMSEQLFSLTLLPWRWRQQAYLPNCMVQHPSWEHMRTFCMINILQQFSTKWIPNTWHHRENLCKTKHICNQMMWPEQGSLLFICRSFQVQNSA